MSVEPQPPTAPKVQEFPIKAVPEAPVKRRATGSLLLTALCTIAGAAIGFLAGAIAFDGGLQISREPSDAVKRALEVTQLSGRVEDLSRDLEAREKELAAEREARRQAVDAARGDTAAAQLKAGFLDSHLSHELARSEASRARLTDAVCNVIRQSQATRTTISSLPLTLTDAQIRAGVRPEVERLLLASGVPAELIARASRKPTEVPVPAAVTQFNVLQVQRAAQARRQVERDAREAVAAIQQQAQNAAIVWAVRFSDGSQFGVPEDVALGLHAIKDCRPG